MLSRLSYENVAVSLHAVSTSIYTPPSAENSEYFVHEMRNFVSLLQEQQKNKIKI